MKATLLSKIEHDPAKQVLPEEKNQAGGFDPCYFAMSARWQVVAAIAMWRADVGSKPDAAGFASGTLQRVRQGLYYGGGHGAETPKIAAVQWGRYLRTTRTLAPTVRI